MTHEAVLPSLANRSHALPFPALSLWILPCSTSGLLGLEQGDLEGPGAGGGLLGGLQDHDAMELGTLHPKGAAPTSP